MHFFRLNVLSQFSEATVLLTNSFKEKITYSDGSKILVTLSISLFIYILYRVMRYGDEETNQQKKLCDYLRDKVKLLLKTWVASHFVIGGSFFGGSLRNLGYQRELAQENSELKVC